MTFRVPGPRGAGGRQVQLPRWPRFVIPAVIIIVALAVLIAIVAGIWTDYLWYSSVHQTRVFGTTYTTKWLLFLVTAVFMGGVVGANLVIAYRLRPEDPPTGPGHQGIEAYRQAIDPHRRGVMIALLGLIGLITGLAAASNWRTWLLFINRVPFGRKDPQFNLDISFYVFDYPFVRMLLSFLFAAVLLALVLSAAVHVLYGGLRISRHARPSRGARTQLLVLAGVFVAFKAVAYWVDRYGINFSQRGVVQTGASYTDVNAVLPAKTVLAVIAVICAVLLLAGAFRRSALVPGIGFGLLVLSAVLIGGVYPFIIQQFVVKPNQQAKERPFIHREIRGTRTAYGVANTRVIRYQGTSTLRTGALAKLAVGAPDLRLMDPGVMPTTFEQLQQVKSYYHFESPLSMDRYGFGANRLPQDTVVGVRDMAGPPQGQDNWINTHLIYTHGFGFVASSASTAAPDGSPNFVEQNIPPTGQLGPFQPRVYFGNEGASYVIVGGRQRELDFPNESSGGQQDNHYHGSGGVPVGSFGSRLLFAVRFRELNILISSAIDSQSRIMYIRDPLERVEKVAPFLTLDGDPYPVIAGRKILWVIDGYTTTDDYPYSRRLNLNQATSNTYSPNGLAVGQTGQINYIRNSVKATVDAYTGAVHIYQWGKASPILTSWMKSFPGLISPQSAIPNQVLPHLRYPEVLFDTQRLILAQYHVTDPAAFYAGQNFWAVPPDPSILQNTAQKQLAGVSQPPYYLTLKVPGSGLPDFSLTSVLTFQSRANLAAFLAVNSNPGSPQYGRITVLQLPQNHGDQRPGSRYKTSSRTSRGPRSSSRSCRKRRVAVSPTATWSRFRLAAACYRSNRSTLPQRLSQRRRLPAAEAGVHVLQRADGLCTQALRHRWRRSSGVSASRRPQTGPGGPPGGQVNALVLQFLQQADRFYAKAQTELKAGRLDLYYQDILKMKAALDQARSAAKPTKTGQQGSVSPTPSPSPSGSASASRSP